MNKLDALVIGAMEVAQTPISFESLKTYLPHDHVFLELWPQVSDIAILHPLQALNIVERLDYALTQPGDVIECGIFQGVTSVLIAKLMDLRQSDKRLLLFDSFQGLPDPDRRVDADRHFQKGGWAARREEVEARLAQYQVLDRCDIYEGWFSDTLPMLDKEQRFCLAYLDADLYASTVDCLTHLWPRMVNNSVTIFDDYHHPSGGVRKAVDDWLVATGEVIHVGPASQSFVIRGFDTEQDNFECLALEAWNQKEILVSFDFLRRNALFCAVIKGRLNHLRAYEEQVARFVGIIDQSPA